MVGICYAGHCWLSNYGAGPRHQGTKAARHAIGKGGFGIVTYDILQTASPRLDLVWGILVLYIKRSTSIY